MMFRQQTIPDGRETCASCSLAIDPDAPAYEHPPSGRKAHVRCPTTGQPHAFAYATRVGSVLYGMDPPAPAGGATWACRCGTAFVSTSDAAAKFALTRHLLESA